jgi:prepilin-type N-terminal cleavage/methylation domain-containing protein
MASPPTDRGFTLIETIVATAILVTALAGIAQLFVLSTHLARRASATGLSLVAAQDKLESLRGLQFIYDADGAAITASGLAPTPSTSLDQDIAGSVDWVDTAGQAVDNPDAAALVRRWKISTVGASPPDAIAIEVCVFKAPAGEADHRAADACLATVRTRQP